MLAVSCSRGARASRLGNVLITGTTSGIGKGLKEAYEAQGRTVVSVSRTGGWGEHQHVADVRDGELAGYILELEARRNGLPTTYILNAGINAEDCVGNFDLETFRHVMEVNLYGVLHFVEAALRLHRAQFLPATFVCVSSTSNLYANPRCLGYYASKLLLHRLFRQFDRRYRSDGLRFKTVILGPVATNIAVNATLPRWQAWVREKITISIEDAVNAIIPFIASTRRVLYYPKPACAVYLGARLLR